eukprot:scaffold6613_cov111-Isochrysis_galbana.AAC.2
MAPREEPPSGVRAPGHIHMHTCAAKSTYAARLRIYYHLTALPPIYALRSCLRPYSLTFYRSKLMEDMRCRAPSEYVCIRCAQKLSNSGGRYAVCRRVVACSAYSCCVYAVLVLGSSSRCSALSNFVYLVYGSGLVRGVRLDL